LGTNLSRKVKKVYTGLKPPALNLWMSFKGSDQIPEEEQGFETSPSCVCHPSHLTLWWCPLSYGRGVFLYCDLEIL